jgi:hypothetical protein
VAIDSLNDPTGPDGTLRLLPDELSGYFWSFRGGTQQQIFYATRPSLAAPFTVTPLVIQPGSTGDLDPTPHPSVPALLFRRLTGGGDLFAVIVNGPAVTGGAMALTALNTGSRQAQPFFPLGGDRLYFSSAPSGIAGDIAEATFSNLTFSAPTWALQLANSDEGDPVVTADGLTLYYRSDQAVTGAYDIYVTTRPAVGVPFAVGVPVPSLNSAADDGPSWLSPNGCRLYLSSDRDGTNDIYVATRGGT